MAIFGIAAARFARRRERVVTVWFAFGAILGPVALAVLYAAPPGRCRSCMFPTRGWLATCAWCRQDVRVDPAQTRVILAKLAASTQERGRAAAALPTSGTRPSAGRGTGPDHAHAAIAVPSGPAPTAVAIAQPPPDPAREAGAPHRAAAAPSASRADRDPVDVGALATATYISGSSSLSPGARYVIGVNRGRLRVHGPVDLNPSLLALTFEIVDAVATTVGGRLLISQHRDGSGAVLAFMQVAGMTHDGLAAAIADAAQAAARP